jgi:hypothetical protein
MTDNVVQLPQADKQDILATRMYTGLHELIAELLEDDMSIYAVIGVLHTAAQMLSNEINYSYEEDEE